jgi:hypothetical protein
MLAFIVIGYLGMLIYSCLVCGTLLGVLTKKMAQFGRRKAYESGALSKVGLGYGKYSGDSSGYKERCVVCETALGALMKWYSCSAETTIFIIRNALRGESRVTPLAQFAELQ